MTSLNGVTIAIVLFGISLLGLILRRDLVIKLLALGLLNGSTILFLVSLNATPSGVPPIVRGPAIAAKSRLLPGP